MDSIHQDTTGYYRERISDELRALPQWVVWRYQERDGKRTKIPHKAVGWGLASSIDPTTWATYEQAVEACRRHRHDGIGFVFSPDDPFTGIDLDNCRDPETGELAPWAAEILALFPGAYAEASPSGTGAHVITRGAAPHNGKRAYQGGAVEVYDRARFFTITGAPL